MKKYIAIVIWVIAIGAITNADQLKKLSCETLIRLPCIQDRLANNEQSVLIDALRKYKSERHSN